MRSMQIFFDQGNESSYSALISKDLRERGGYGCCTGLCLVLTFNPVLFLFFLLLFYLFFTSAQWSCVWHWKLCMATKFNSLLFTRMEQVQVRAMCHQQQPLLLLVVVYWHEPVEIKFVSSWWPVLCHHFTGMRKKGCYCSPFLWKGGEGKKAHNCRRCVKC